MAVYNCSKFDANILFPDEYIAGSINY